MQIKNENDKKEEDKSVDKSQMNEHKIIDWFAKHSDAATTIGTILIAVIWMSTHFSNIDDSFKEIDIRLNSIDHRLTVIETVLVMKNIMPQDLSCNMEKK